MNLWRLLISLTLFAAGSQIYADSFDSELNVVIKKKDRALRYLNALKARPDHFQKKRVYDFGSRSIDIAKDYRNSKDPIRSEISLKIADQLFVFLTSEGSTIPWVRDLYSALLKEDLYTEAKLDEFTRSVSVLRAASGFGANAEKAIAVIGKIGHDDRDAYPIEFLQNLAEKALETYKTLPANSKKRIFYRDGTLFRELASTFAQEQEYEKARISLECAREIFIFLTSGKPVLSWVRHLYEAMVGESFHVEVSLDALSRSVAIVGAAWTFGNNFDKAIEVIDTVLKLPTLTDAATRIVHAAQIFYCQYSESQRKFIECRIEPWQGVPRPVFQAEISLHRHADCQSSELETFELSNEQHRPKQENRVLLSGFGSFAFVDRSLNSSSVKEIVLNNCQGTLEVEIKRFGTTPKIIKEWSEKKQSLQHKIATNKKSMQMTLDFNELINTCMTVDGFIKLLSQKGTDQKKNLEQIKAALECDTHQKLEECSRLEQGLNSNIAISAEEKQTIMRLNKALLSAIRSPSFYDRLSLDGLLSKEHYETWKKLVHKEDVLKQNKRHLADLKKEEESASEELCSLWLASKSNIDWKENEYANCH